jgi:hypothetical protein
LSFAATLCGVLWTNYGLGQHLDEISPSHKTAGYKTLFAPYLFFTAGVDLIKVSALLFYTRVFRKVDCKPFRMAIYVTHGLVVLWLLAFIPMVIFNCFPPKKFWDPTSPGSCLELYPWYMACGVYDAVTDVIVLTLPMPMLRKLKMGWEKKTFVFFAFFCGYL